MDDPDRTCQHQVAKLAKDVFHIYAEERAAQRAAEENRVLRGVSKLNNAASYLAALTDLASKQLQKDIIAFARIHAREFTRFGLPCDARVEADLDATASQMAGGTHARLLHQLNLIEKRAKRQLMLSTSSGHIARSIARSTNMGVRKGKIIVQRQRIKAGISPHGVAMSFPKLHRQDPESHVYAVIPENEVPLGQDAHYC